MADAQGLCDNLTDAQVVWAGKNALAAAYVEMMKRLRATILEQNRTATNLNQKLLKLNVQPVILPLGFTSLALFNYFSLSIKSSLKSDPRANINSHAVSWC